jgi:hypothetical protein
MEKWVLLSFATFLMSIIIMVVSIFNNNLIYIFMSIALTICTSHIVVFAVSLYKKENKIE